MKKQLKRALSLVLAMLMVMGTLPMNVFALEMLDGEDSVGQVETPILDGDGGSPAAGFFGGEIYSGQELPEPVPSGDPEEGEILWTNVTLDAVLVDADSGEVRITATLTSAGNAGLGNAAIVLAPVHGSNTVRAMAADGDISTATTASWLNTNLAAGLGVNASLIHIADVSTGKFSSGVWTYTATLGSGMSYADYIAAANTDGSSISEATGIPMQVMLISQGDNPGICFADVVIQPRQAILTIDGTKPDVSDKGDGVDTIYLDSSDGSFKFDIKHTDASTETANIMGVTWVGNNGVSFDMAMGDTLTKADGARTVSATLDAGPADWGADPYVGDVVIAYNDAINSSYRYLRVHVLPSGVEPIVIEVTAGQDDNGTTNYPNIYEAGWVVTGDAVDELYGGGGAPVGVTSSEDGITLTLIEDGIYTSVFDLVITDEDGELAGFAVDPIEPGESLGDLVNAAVDADKAPGTYAAGAVTVNLIDVNLEPHVFNIPVIVKVKAPNSYDAIFYANSGTWTEGEGTVTNKTVSTTDETKKGSAIPASDIPGTVSGGTPSASAPTRTGYTFQGWGTSASAETPLTAANIKYSASATTPNKYYAIWKKDATDYSLTYNANGGTGGPAQQTASDASGQHTFNLEFTNNLPTRDGYVFAGWSDSSGNNNTADYTSTGTTSVTVPEANPDKTVYAVWTKVYTVTYVNAAAATYPQIATLPTDNTKYKAAQQVTVSSTPTAGTEGSNSTTGLYYTFTGWSDGTNTRTPGATFNMGTSDVTLTAVWSPVNLTVTYALDGGTAGSPAGTNTVQKGGDYTIDAGDPTKNGYSFGGWKLTAGTATTATGTVLDGGDKVEGVMANITLTAQWSADDTQAIFYLNGGDKWKDNATDASVTVSGAAGGNANPPAAKVDPVREHYKFDGWATANNATAADAVTPKFPAIGADPNEYYAIWTPKYTVTYDWGDFDGTPTTTTGTAATLPTQAEVVKDEGFNVSSAPNTTTTYVDDNGLGWTLVGWTASGGGQSGDKAPGAAITNVTGNVTLTAKWTAKNFTVTFNGNGGKWGSDTTKSETVQYGDTVAAPAQEPVLTNSTRIGWNTNAAGTGAAFDPAAKVTANATYYAIWQGDTGSIKVTALLDGDPYANQTVTLDGTAHSGTTAADGTYTFSNLPVGSYTVKVAGKTVSTVTVTKDDTAEAEAKFWTVTANVAATGGGYVKAGTSASPTVGSDTTSSVIVYNGETAYVNAKAADYYKFSAWSTGVSGTTTTAANSVTNVTDTTTVTATFVAKTSNVTVTLHVDNSTASPGRAVEITLNSETKTIASGSTSVTFNNVPQSATAYPITAEGVNYGTVTVGNANDGTTVNTVVDFATAEVKTGGNGHATVTIAKYGDLTDDLTATTTDVANNTASVIGLKGQTATWSGATPVTNYSFKSWDSATGNTTADQNATLATSKVTHTAYFNKTSYDTYLTLTLNGANVTDTTTGWTVKLGSITATYDSTNNRWVAAGVPSASTDDWTVTTPNTGDYTVDNEGDGGTASLALYGLKTVDTDYDTAQATMAVNSKTGLTQAEVKLNAAVTLTVTAATGYTHASPYWKEGTASQGTVAQGSYTLTKAITADQTLTPTFTYTAIIKPTRGGAVYDVDTVVVKTGSTTVGTATEQADKTWKVSGLTIDTDYDIWVNGYLSDKDTDGINEVEVPIWKLTTADDPTNSAATKTVKTKTVIDMPNGANDTNMALAATAASGYRLRTATETPATWTSSDAIAAVATTMDKVTVTNITKDVTLTVNTVKQWKVSVVNDDKNKGTLTAPTISAGGTVATIDSTGSYKNNLVDDNGTITVAVTPQAGYTPSWKATDSGGNEITGLTLPGTVTVDKDMTITVTYEATKYDVEVKVNLDNAAKGGLPGTQLYLVKGSDTVALTETGTAGTYTAKVVPGTYTIWSPVASANGATAETTGRTISFSVQDGEKSIGTAGATGDAANLKAELNYYTIKIEKKFSDNPADAAKPTDIFASHGSSAPSAAANEVTSKIYLAGKGAATVNVPVAATANNSSTPYYKWSRWDKGTAQSVVSARTGNYVLSGENTLKADSTITSATPITLTALFQRQYKVTLKNPAAAGSSAAPTGGVQANFGSATKVSNATQETSKYALVDQGSDLSISSLSLINSTERGNYIYSGWAVDQTGGTANGSFSGTNATTGATTFTPVADAEVTPSYWLKPTLTPAKDTYHQNYDPGETIPTGKLPANFGKTKNDLAKFTWTANDAALDGVYITIDGTETKLTDGVEYTYSSGVITFKEDYLAKTLKGKNTGNSYTVTVKSKTPASGTDTDLTAALVIYNTPEPLVNVTIKVNADKATNTPYETLNITEGNKSGQTGRKTAIYQAHTDTRIVKENKLKFTWYYGDTKPTPEQLEDSSQTAVDKATIKVTNTYGGQLLSSLATLTNEFDLNDATVIPNAILTSDTLKGKYIYAVVEASVTGKGAVITNAIPVDYDAVVKVTKDGSDTITGGNYTVYLVPQGTTANADSYAAASLPTGSVQAKYQSANQYKTDDSALTGGTTYDVYVNRVEGDTTLYVKTGETVKTQTAAAAAPTVPFFSVNAVETALKHAKDKAGADVGEDFTGGNAKPSTAFTAGGAGSNTIDVDTGMGVFSGTKVTAKASKTWGQDYWWNWQSNGNGTFASYGSEHQASGAATKEYTVSAKTYIGGQMEQKTYTVTGNIWATGNNNNAGIKEPLLTANGHEFNGTVTSNGKHKGTVTFTVPKSGVTGGAINENYKLSAKTFDGTETTQAPVQVTNLLKYAAYTNVASLANTTANDNTVLSKAALTDDKIAQVTADNTSAFTIVVTASKWQMTVADDGAGVTGDITSTFQTLNSKYTTAPNAVSTTASFTEKYADRTADKVYLVNLTNDETTNLTVTLTLTKQVMTNGTWGAATTVGLSGLTGGKYTDADNGITIANLPAAAFDLLAGDSLTDKYTVTIPDELEATRVRYSFAFTSVDKDKAGVFGPSVTYVLDIKVDPLPITAIGSKTISGGYEADGLKLDSKNPPAGVTVDDEVEYVWYTVPVGTVPTLTKATGALSATGIAAAAGDQSDGTYQMVDTDTGRDLYLVAKHKGTGNVIESAMTKVATLPYAISIKVQEDTAPVASKANYKVYLWDDAKTGAFDPATAIEATATPTTNDGLYKTAAVLVPGKTYSIYTNAVGGTVDKHWRDSGENVVLANYTGNNTPTVTYHELVLNNTLVDNKQYSAGITDNTAPFYKTVDGTTVTSIGIDALNAPTAKYGATDAVNVATSSTSANRWVQKGATVNLAYAAWTRDYTLGWSNNTTVATNDKAAGSTGTVAVSGAKTTVDTKLTLNLYTVALTVAGPGLLDEVTMNDGTRDFTLSAGNFHATGTSVPNIGNGGYTFTVPTGTYTVLGNPATASTQIDHYKIPANSSDKILPANIGSSSITVTDNTKSFLIQLDAVGQFMSVEDDQKPVDNTTITAHVAGNAGWDGTTKTDDTAGSTIVLPYGYGAAKTVTVSVANTSGENNNLYDVTWTAAATGNSDKITASAGTMDGTQNILYPSGAAKADDPLTATLTVATGLPVGDHIYKADVTFSTTDGGSTQPKVTYTLTVKVVPTEFTAVTVADEGGNAVSGMLPLGMDLQFSTFTTGSQDDWDGTTGVGKTLVAGTDYTYQWYHGTTASPTVNWNDSGASATATPTGDLVAIDGATGATLDDEVIANYPGENIYLVISAVKDKNVIKAAISAPVTTGFQPVVKITKDHVDQSDGTGYTVKLTSADGSKTYATAWSTDKGGFVPVDAGKEISLPSGEYTVYAAKYEGQNPSVIGDMVAQTTKLNLTTAATKVDTVKVPYFTVNAVKTKAFEAFAGRNLGEDFDGAAKDEGPTPVLKFGATAINSGTAVLKGQSVNAAIADGDKWTQDYTLTWYDKLDGNTTGTNTAPTFANAYEATGNTMDPTTTKQNATAAATTGYQNVAVSETLYIGGRLDQNKYTITVGITGSGKVDAVETTLSGSDPAESFTGTLDDKDNNSEFNAGDTMTFTVVAGNYDIAATRGSGTNIVSIQWESQDPVDGDTLSDRPVVKNPTKGNYDVLITIESADLNLTVSDGAKTASAGTGEAKGVTNTEVRYFSGIPAGDKLVLSLTNTGNMPLDTTMTVYHFDKLTDVPDYATAANWTTAPTTGYLGAAPTTTGDLADTLFQNEGRQVITVTGVMANGTTVEAKAGQPGGPDAVTAGTITIGTGAFNKDDGVYVFRFVGDDDDASTPNPVVYYVLDLRIQPLPIKEVAAESGISEAPGVGDKVQLKDATSGTEGGFENVKVNDGTADVAADTVTDPALEDNTDKADVKYQWVWTASEMTPANVRAAIKVDDDTGAISSTNTNVKLRTGNGADSKQYTLQTADLNGYLYLVAYAPGAGVNASERAVSAAIQTKHIAGVKVSLDGTVLPDTTDAVKPDPGYTVYLVESGKTFDADNTDGSTGTWATTWNTTTGRYEAPIDLTKPYDVYALTYKDGNTVVKAIDETLGKQGDNSIVRERTVPYHTVKFTEDVDVVNGNAEGFASYLPGANDLQKALSVQVSDDRKSTTYKDGDFLTETANGTPVLEGVNVKVAVDGTAVNDAADPKAWSDYSTLHTMDTAGWGKDSNTATSGTKIGYAATITSGDIEVKAAKTFSAQLKPVLFTVVFGVEDISADGPKNTAISSATLSGGGFTQTVTVEGGGITNGGANGATVTFTNVPAGQLSISAKEKLGTATMVSGYTWNNRANVQSKGTNIVTVVEPGTPDTNQDKDNNTILIEEAFSRVAWFDDFDTEKIHTGSEYHGGTPANGYHGTNADGTKAFEYSSGFARVDDAPEFRSLVEGYAAVTYTVRVQNAGSEDLSGFYVLPNASDFTFDLTKAKWYDADGNVKAETHDATTPFDLLRGEYLEFDVTIPAGKKGNVNDYTGVFQAVCDDDKLGGGTYDPKYHVRSPIDFEPGQALVTYGNRKFDSNQDVALKNWPTNTGEPAPTFTFEIMALDGTNDAATLKEINDALGLSLTTLDAKPSWLTMNANTGAFTFTQTTAGTNDPAVGVNVEVQAVDGKLPDDLEEYGKNAGYQVEDEVVLYLKATNVQGETFIIPYTVNVEPGQLVIDNGAFDQTGAVGGKKVDLSKFTYDTVKDQAGSVIVPAATPTNTAAGNDPDSAGNGKVFVNNGTDDVITATWKVTPTNYATGPDNYTFKVTYTPANDAAKWNYKPATKTESVDAEAPPIGLKFSDVRSNGDDVDDSAATITMVNEDNTLVGADGDDLSAATPQAEQVTREGERIVYLDEVPTYQVSLKSVGEGVHDLTLTATTTVENAGEYGGFSFTHVSGALQPTGGFKMTDAAYVFDLTPDKLGDKLFAGTYHVKLTAAGYSDPNHAADAQPDVTATYEITFVIDPRPIVEADVTGLEPPTLGGKQDEEVEVKPTLEGDDDPDHPMLDPDGKDKNGVTPVKPTVDWKPKKDPVTDGDYTVTITLEPDPNYVFVPEVTPDPDDPTKEPNYTLDDKGDKEWPEGDPGLTVEKKDDDVVYTKDFTVVLPGYLTYDDVKKDATTDKLGPDVNVKRTIRIPKGTKAESMTGYIYDVNLNSADHEVYGVTVTADKELPAGWSLSPASTYPETVGDLPLGTPHTHVLDLSGISTEADMTQKVTFTAKGYSTEEKFLAGGEPDVEATYTVEVVIYTTGGGGGGGFTPCPHQVSFLLGLYGTTTDPVMDMVADKAKISKEPVVTAVNGWKFLGWSMAPPSGDTSKDAKRELVVPKDVSITSDTNFYAVYEPAYELGRPFHEHYVIGYPNGNFGPDDNINRASVATIIARAVLPNFVEGADYGNPGGYSDVSGHWAASAIAYCSKYGVFNGYTDGTFRPDQPITRQEFALVIARLDGVLKAGNMPFTDIGDAGDWALGGIYTAYVKGWVNGYTDGTFKPLDFIRRDEAVKVFNAYLYRGVDAAGLADLKEYIHSGVASNNTENGTTEYMTWPDVPKGHWAYYEIIEAANDHEYTVDTTQVKGYTVPEHWDKCWIDEKWRYHDDLNDGGPATSLMSAGFRVWTEA